MENHNKTIATNKRLAALQRFVGNSFGEGASPVTRWLGGRLLELEEGRIRMEFVVRADMCNPMAVLHGGIAATMLDDLVGIMVYAMGRDFAYTSVNLNMDYLHAARVGDVLIAEGEVIRAGKNIMHTEGTLVNKDGKIVAKCSSNLIQTSLRLDQ